MVKNKPTLYYLVGLPASGKSTYANKLKEEHDCQIFSSDSIREELYGDENIQKDNQKVFNILHKRIRECLRSGHDACYDATNVKSKNRRAFMQYINKVKCVKKCIIIATPYEKCLHNNLNRKRVVPEYAIKNMYMSWETPYVNEGWDNIDIVYQDEGDVDKDIYSWLKEHIDYEQDNPNHSLTLGDHCISVGYDIWHKYYDPILFCAGLLHDCGKPFTKDFKNHKGEETNIAHYYNHQHVGAYNSLFFIYPENVQMLDVSVLISLHMHPYSWKDNEDKMKSKYRRIWGDKLFEDVMKLHEVDKYSH